VLHLVQPAVAGRRLGAVRDDLQADLAGKSAGVAAGGSTIFNI
jgi:hypothetical protein